VYSIQNATVNSSNDYVLAYVKLVTANIRHETNLPIGALTSVSL